MTGPVRGAISRSFDILEFFRARRLPARLKDVVDALGYPTSTTADLLKEMAGAGYLAFHTPTRTYFPTPAVAALGSWIDQAGPGHMNALAIARQLNDATDELILVGTENGLHVQYLEALRSRHPVQYVVAAGTKRFLVKSGVGWALLAQEEDKRVERAYRRTVATAAGRADQPPSLADLLARLATIRREGYALSRNLLYNGASIIAAAVPCGPGARQLAIGIAGPTERIEEQMDTYVRLLLKAIGASTKG